MTKVTFLESPGSIDYCYVFGFHREFRLRPKIVKASRGKLVFGPLYRQLIVSNENNSACLQLNLTAVKRYGHRWSCIGRRNGNANASLPLPIH